jgi:hypothetical protein
MTALSRRDWACHSVTSSVTINDDQDQLWRLDSFAIALVAGLADRAVQRYLLKVIALKTMTALGEANGTSLSE